MEPWILKCSEYRIHPKATTRQVICPTPTVSAGARWGLRVGISNKYQGGVVVLIQDCTSRTQLENILRCTSLISLKIDRLRNSSPVLRSEYVRAARVGGADRESIKSEVMVLWCTLSSCHWRWWDIWWAGWRWQFIYVGSMQVRGRGGEVKKGEPRTGMAWGKTGNYCS